MDYRLLLKEGRWYAYNIIVDGVSLVKNYRSQFQKIIRESSYSGVGQEIARMDPYRGEESETMTGDPARFFQTCAYMYSSYATVVVPSDDFVKIKTARRDPYLAESRSRRRQQAESNAPNRYKNFVLARCSNDGR